MRYSIKYYLEAAGHRVVFFPSAVVRRCVETKESVQLMFISAEGPRRQWLAFPAGCSFLRQVGAGGLVNYFFVLLLRFR